MLGASAQCCNSALILFLWRKLPVLCINYLSDRWHLFPFSWRSFFNLTNVPTCNWLMCWYFLFCLLLSIRPSRLLTGRVSHFIFSDITNAFSAKVPWNTCTLPTLTSLCFQSKLVPNNHESTSQFDSVSSRIKSHPFFLLVLQVPLLLLVLFYTSQWKLFLGSFH